MQLVDFEAQVASEYQARRDFLAPAARLRAAYSVGPSIEMELSGGTAVMVPTEHAHGQIAAAAGIPKAYYDRMRNEEPHLWATTLNTWHARPELNENPRLVRTLSATSLRGWLTNGYRPLDNFDVWGAVKPTFAEFGLDIQSSQLSESRMYVRGVSRRLEGEIRKGDVVQGGVCIRNSEVGNGARAVELFIMRLVCLNGMVAATILRKAHVGRRQYLEEGSVGVELSAQTQALSDAALLGTMRDAVAGILDGRSFNAWLDTARASADDVAPDKSPLEIVEITANKLGFRNGEKSTLAEGYLSGRDYSRWGLANAVTALARETAEPDRRYDLERTGAYILELPSLSHFLHPAYKAGALLAA